MVGTIRTGIAGWVYEPWRGSFYPAGLVQKKELEYAASQLGSIEINATFRANPSPESVGKWASQVPEDFVFGVKGPMLVTHRKRLKDVEIPLANFFACGILALGRHLGPFVWQLPENLKFDTARIETFLDLLPHTTADLIALGQKHDDRLGHAPALDVTGIETVRHAIEVRHESFADPTFIAMLRARNVALVCADTPSWPWRDLTADFAYCRLQGPPRAEATGYAPADLDALAQQFGQWARGHPGAGPFLAPPIEPLPAGRDVFAYFVHEDKLHAPDNARAVAERVA